MFRMPQAEPPAQRPPRVARRAGGRRGGVPGGLLAAPACPTGDLSTHGRRRRRRRPGSRRRDRRRPGQGRADPAAVGQRQCRARRPVDAQRRRDGARRVQQSEHPAAGARTTAAPPRARSRPRSRRSTKAPRSSSVRCSPNRSAPAGQVARARGVPVIAFSTDANVAARGVYLLSFLPESDVDRDRRLRRSRRASARSSALVPDNAYGIVVEAEFKQMRRAQGRPRRRARALSADRRAACRTPRSMIAQAAARADAIFIPDGGDAVAGGGAGARRQRRQPQAPAAPRHRPVGRSAHLRRAGAAGRLVSRRPIPGRLPHFLRPLSRALRPGPGAHRDARL